MSLMAATDLSEIGHVECADQWSWAQVTHCWHMPHLSCIETHNFVRWVFTRRSVSWEQLYPVDLCMPYYVGLELKNEQSGSYSKISHSDTFSQLFNLALFKKKHDRTAISSTLFCLVLEPSYWLLISQSKGSPNQNDNKENNGRRSRTYPKRRKGTEA